MIDVSSRLFACLAKYISSIQNLEISTAMHKAKAIIHLCTLFATGGANIQHLQVIRHIT